VRTFFDESYFIEFPTALIHIKGFYRMKFFKIFCFLVAAGCNFTFGLFDISDFFYRGIFDRMKCRTQRFDFFLMFFPAFPAKSP